VLPHAHDVLAVAFRPDGKQLACATLDGQLHLWDPLEGELQVLLSMSSLHCASTAARACCFHSARHWPWPVPHQHDPSAESSCLWHILSGNIGSIAHVPSAGSVLIAQGTIEGRRDIAGGRLAGDKRSLVNTASGQCFTSLTYSADGSQLLAGMILRMYAAKRSLSIHNTPLGGIIPINIQTRSALLQVAGQSLCASTTQRSVSCCDASRCRMLASLMMHMICAATCVQVLLPNICAAHHACTTCYAGVQKSVAGRGPGPAELANHDRCRAGGPHSGRTIG
jgi:WD40 repeat protein